MCINKNDCLDCANSHLDSYVIRCWICSKGNIIPKDKDGLIEVFENDCKDFSYQE